MAFQSYALCPHKSVHDNMAVALKMAKIPPQDIARSVHEAAEFFQPTEFLQRLPKALSGGQRQRGAIGRAIVRNTQMFLLDEHLSNLDAALRTKMRVEPCHLAPQVGGHQDVCDARSGRGHDTG